ncbi:transposase family protein [Bradyrhizobium sp. 197]|nr:transposase family protein [Bradyrhizobium sp. 197]
MLLASGGSALPLSRRGRCARLERICKTVGYPKTIRVDQGSEFVSRDLHIQACQKGVVLDFSRPGKPTDNSFIESSTASSEPNA